MKCLICGKEFKSVTSAHLRLHGIARQEYMKKYNTECVSEETKERCRKIWKEKYVNGYVNPVLGMVGWSSGLTKENSDSIRKQCEKRRLRYERLSEEEWNNIHSPRYDKLKVILSKDNDPGRVERSRKARIEYCSNNSEKVKEACRKGARTVKEDAVKSAQKSEKIRIKRALQVIPFKDTSIEVALQDGLRNKGIEFRKHEPILGQPDIFIEPNICIFCDGDYWHNRPEMVRRDSYVIEHLLVDGYVVLRFWEHDIVENIEDCLRVIMGSIIKNQRSCRMADEKVTDIKIGFKYVGGKACPPIFKNDYYMSIFAPEDIPMPPGQTAVVKTGVVIDVPEGVAATIHQSSGLIARRMGIMNSGAIIESGLHEVVIIMVSQNQLIQTVNQGEEVARLSFTKLLSADTKPILEMA